MIKIFNSSVVRNYFYTISILFIALLAAFIWNNERYESTIQDKSTLTVNPDSDSEIWGRMCIH